LAKVKGTKSGAAKEPFEAEADKGRKPPGFRRYPESRHEERKEIGCNYFERTECNSIWNGETDGAKTKSRPESVERARKRQRTKVWIVAQKSGIISIRDRANVLGPCGELNL